MLGTLRSVVTITTIYIKNTITERKVEKMNKKTISTCIVILLSLFGLYCCYDYYQLYEPVEKTKLIQETGINLVAKAKYDDETMYVTVRVENGWLKKWAENYLLLTDMYGKDFVTVYLEDKDRDVIKKVEFSIKDFIEIPEEHVYIAKKSVEITAKKRRKIKQIGCSYRGLYSKELVR